MKPSGLRKLALSVLEIWRYILVVLDFFYVPALEGIQLMVWLALSLQMQKHLDGEESERFQWFASEIGLCLTRPRSLREVSP